MSMICFLLDGVYNMSSHDFLTTVDCDLDLQGESSPFLPCFCQDRKVTETIIMTM